MKYQIVTTKDGSPTLLWQNEEVAEYMHHSGGALAESLYIYGEALDLALESGWPPRVFSLGLGLGYNEMIALTRLHTRSNWKIWSFESIPLLQEGFRAWAEKREAELAETYARVAKMIAEKFALEPETLREAAAKALASGQLELRGAYPEHASGMHDVSCVFYDAYSTKMTPELWHEAEMIELLKPVLATNCVFTTYAARGSLNRVLRTLGFKVQKKDGFASKRESTIATRQDL